MKSSSQPRLLNKRGSNYTLQSASLNSTVDASLADVNGNDSDTLMAALWDKVPTSYNFTGLINGLTPVNWTESPSDQEPIFNATVWYNNHTLHRQSLERALLSEVVPCACNCSYTSFACCYAFDGIVHEDPSHNIGVLAQCTLEELHNANGTNGTFSGDSLTSSNTSSLSPAPTQMNPAGVNFANIATISEVTEGVYSLKSKATMKAQLTASASVTYTVSQSVSSATASSVCQSTGNVCNSFWGCGDGAHCYCGSIPNQFLGFTYFHCFPKYIANTSSSTGNNDKRDESSLVAGLEVPSFDTAICPCNCTYSSHACCEEPSGEVFEPPSSNNGPVRLPIGECCDKSDGQVKKSGQCTS